jgi:hypothetical protein
VTTEPPTELSPPLGVTELPPLAPPVACVLPPELLVAWLLPPCGVVVAGPSPDELHPSPREAAAVTVSKSRRNLSQRPYGLCVFVALQSEINIILSSGWCRDHGSILSHPRLQRRASRASEFRGLASSCVVECLGRQSRATSRFEEENPHRGAQEEATVGKSLCGHQGQWADYKQAVMALVRRPVCDQSPRA